MEKVKIVIAGTPYNIATDSDSAYTLDLAEEIESRITGFMQSGNFVSPAQATVLSLLDYADELRKLDAENQNMRQQLKEYLADAAQAKSERDMYKRELAKLRKGNSGER